MDFQDKVQTLINQCSLENASDTPDFILAQYIQGCLDIWEESVRARDKWHGFRPFGNNKNTRKDK